MKHFLQVSFFIFLVLYSLYSLFWGLLNLEREKPILDIYSLFSIWWSRIFRGATYANQERKRILKTKDFKLLAKVALAIGIFGLAFSIVEAISIF